MKIEQIKPNSIINLDFSTQFYQRLQSLTVHFTQQKTPEELKVIYAKYGTSVELDEYEFDLETVLILMKSLEDGARSQGFAEEVELPVIS